MQASRSSLFLSILALGVVATLGASPGSRGFTHETEISPDRLGGKERFLTHLSTDKPIYRIGEELRLRGVILDAWEHKPSKDVLPVQVEVLGPRGEVVASETSPVSESVLAFSWKIPEGQAGGQYRVKVTHPFQGHAPAERGFEVRAYRPPRLKTEITFLRDGYGPGEEVQATLEVSRAEGGPPLGARVTAVVRVDGREVFHQPVGRVDAQGRVELRFPLPASIERGEGTLAMIVEDGGIVETATKTVPILLRDLDLGIYPEGGELVAGLESRIYFEARTPSGKPADFAGQILDRDGAVVAELKTFHEGRGRVSLRPERNQLYRLKIQRPSGIQKLFELPRVQPEGVTLSTSEDVVEAGAPVRFRVGTSSQERLKITLARREVELDEKSLTLEAGREVELRFQPEASLHGVLRLTVWNQAGKPLAERLLFRQPQGSLKIQVEANRERFVPGDEVVLKVRTTDEAGTPVSAVVGLTVTDDATLEMLERRDQAPRLPVQVLLETEVLEMADAAIYLDPENPRAAQATDLLLGTQGWRRFAFAGEIAEFMQRHGDPARRVLAFRQPMMEHRFPRFAVRGAWDEKGAVDQIEMALPNKAVMPPALPPAPAPPQVEPLLAPMPAPILAERKAKEHRGRRLRLEQPQKVYARVYAHPLRAGRNPGERVDFTETVYWSAGLPTSETGELEVRFHLSDSVTGFRVMADGFTPSGHLGSTQKILESVEPFYLEPKLPLEVSSGDLVRLPVGVINGTQGPMDRVNLVAEAGDLLRAGTLGSLTLAKEERGRSLLDLRVGEAAGLASLVLKGRSGAYHDAVTRTLKVAPRGFPIQLSQGGMLGSQNPVSWKLEIPEDVRSGSLRTKISLYPSPLAQLTDALERLIQEPHGCFEQTSSTNYPLVMAQQYFLSHAGVDPDLIRRSQASLDKGYQRLLSFECKKSGYEWFGEDPGHEALSAYGLMEFTDMSRVRTVDEGMLQRTQSWLLGTRDGEGGFRRQRRALHTWVTDSEISNAYILWALLEAGQKGLETEVSRVSRDALQSKNSYVLALSANVLQLAGQTEQARSLLKRLGAAQTKDGVVQGATGSIVGSGGEALKIETTSLAVLAWLRDHGYVAEVEAGIRYLAKVCEGGRYGSTQSTVLALRAIVAYDQARARDSKPGEVILRVDGVAVGKPVAFGGDALSVLDLPDLSSKLAPGSHQISLQMADGRQMPYSMAVRFHSLTPASALGCALDLQVQLSQSKLREGEPTEARVRLKNRLDQAIPTPVAILGVPGGLEPRHEQLKELVKAEKIAAYEVLGRDVVLYWRSLPAGAQVEIPLSLVAEIPGRYTGPASRAYLYYTDELKTWVEGMEVSIEPR